MKNYISKNKIQEIIAKTNIIDLIKSNIEIKKKGKNYQGFCPFHTEKNPSFTINEEKQFYYCFGCHSHGNIIDFLINYNKFTFIETIEYLSEINNIPIKYKKTIFKKKITYKKLFYYTNNLSKFYQKKLKENQNAQKYLKIRKIKKKDIDFFNIGFSQENLAKKNIKKIKTKKILTKLGILTKNKNGNTCDLLFNRITFPIRNIYGKIIGFGGRTINNNLPKYLNSSETEIFNKKKELYGLFETLQKNKQPKKIVVVEGYLDVITLFQYNIKYTVAILGTNISYQHIEKLLHYTKTIIYCYDGDSAGKKASWETLKKMLPYMNDGVIVKFIFLPKETDPDSIIKKEGIKKFKNRIKNSKTLSNFLFKKLLKKNNLSSIEEKTKFSSNIIPLINTIPGKIMRFYLYKKLSDKVGNYNIIQFNNYNYTKIIKKNNIIKKKKINILISLLIQNPKLVNIIPSIIELDCLKYPDILIFRKIYRICLKNNKITTGQIMEYYRGKKIEQKIKILSLWNHYLKKKEIKIFFLDILIMIYNEKLRKRQKKILLRERKKKIKKKDKQEFWLINKELKKK